MNLDLLHVTIRSLTDTKFSIVDQPTNGLFNEPEAMMN